MAGTVGAAWRALVLAPCAQRAECVAAVCTLAVPTALFALAVAATMALDLWQAPRWLYRYKFDRAHALTWERARAALPLTALVAAAVHAPGSYLAMRLLLWRGCAHLDDELPALVPALLQCAAISACAEVWTYAAHRLLHWPPVYNRCHRIHHEWTRPVGFTVLYLHPFDHAFMNVPAMFLGASRAARAAHAAACAQVRSSCARTGCSRSSWSASRR